MQLATVLWPLAFAVIGALVYALSSNGKVAQLGLVMYGSGMLWLVYVLAHVSLRIGA